MSIMIALREVSEKLEEAKEYIAHEIPNKIQLEPGVLNFVETRSGTINIDRSYEDMYNGIMAFSKIIDNALRAAEEEEFEKLK
jgi:hypothetical protein